MMPPCHHPGDTPNPCAVRVYSYDTRGNLTLGGPWRGWRLQAGVLVGPGGVRWTPDTLEHAHRWQKSGLAG